MDQSSHCFNKDACPHLGYRSCCEVIAENERLKRENGELRSIFGKATEAFTEKQEEMERIRRENEALRRKLNDLYQKPFVREEDDEEEENGQEEKGAAEEDKDVVPKKRGAPVGHRGGTRKKPVKEPDIRLFVPAEKCPHCGSENVSPCKDVQEHTLEDIQILRPVVILVRRQRGYCLDCGELFSTRLPEDIPKGFIGPVARAVAGYLHYSLRIPFEVVAQIFEGLFGMPITPQALVGFDKKLAEEGRPLYELIEDMARYSNAANADETGWPVGGDNEWLWVYCNPGFVLFKIAPSRAGAVVEGILGERYGGVLGSDCFGAYNKIKAKAKQKCLTHYERAAKDLEKFYPDDEVVVGFACSLKDIFKRARQAKRDWLEGKISDDEARKMAEKFEKEIDVLTETALENEDARKLRNRLIRHRDENFIFLRYREVEPDNNRAERALRPSVVMRKVSYGNNSRTGARNHETLMSLIETGKLHGTKPLDLLRGLACGTKSEKLKEMILGLSTDGADSKQRIREKAPG